jgi:hypothetical protein
VMTTSPFSDPAYVAHLQDLRLRYGERYGEVLREP